MIVMTFKKYNDKYGKIPLKRPSGVPQDRWQKALDLYKAAQDAGDPYPTLTVSQAALETGWFKSDSGKFNYFGQKATQNQQGSDVVTHEYENGKRVQITDRFRDYDSLDDALSDRLMKWGTKYTGAPTIKDAVYSIWKYDENKKQGTGYATDIAYDQKLFKIMRMMGVQTDKKAEQGTRDLPPKVQIDKTYVPEISSPMQPAKLNELFRFDSYAPKEEAETQQILNSRITNQQQESIQQQVQIPEIDPSLYNYIQLEEF